MGYLFAFLMIVLPIHAASNPDLISQYDDIFRRVTGGNGEKKPEPALVTGVHAPLKVGKVDFTLLVLLHPAMQFWNSEAGTFWAQEVARMPSSERKKLVENGSRRIRQYRSRLDGVKSELAEARSHIAALELRIAQTASSERPEEEEKFWSERAALQQKMEKLQEELEGDLLARAYPGIFMGAKDRHMTFSNIVKEVRETIEAFRQEENLDLILNAQGKPGTNPRGGSIEDLVQDAPQQLDQFLGGAFFLGDGHASVSDAGVVAMLKPWLQQREKMLVQAFEPMGVILSDTRDLTGAVLEKVYLKHDIRADVMRRVVRLAGSLQGERL